MGKLTVSKNNVNLPAPRWFRRLKKAIYLLQAGGIFTGALTRLHISAEDQLFTVACLTVGLEALGALLANGEIYQDTNDKPAN